MDSVASEQPIDALPAGGEIPTDDLAFSSHLKQHRKRGLDELSFQRYQCRLGFGIDATRATIVATILRLERLDVFSAALVTLKPFQDR